MSELKECLEKMKKDQRPGVKHYCHQIHNHPSMERQCKVEDGHVIIDKDLFDAIRLLHGDKLDF